MEEKVKRTKNSSILFVFIQVIFICFTYNCNSKNTAGSVGGGDTNSVPTTFTIGGTVHGLTGGQSVDLSNGADTLHVVSNGVFTFSVALASGVQYNVQVTAKTMAFCNAVNNTGTVNSANVTNVGVYCSAVGYVVSGNVSGLPAPGDSVTLQLNGTNNQTITNPGTTFTFLAIADGTPYLITTLSKSVAGLGCYGGTDTSGAISGAAVNTAQVNCKPCFPGGAKTITVKWTASRSYDVYTATGGGHKIYYDTVANVSKTTPGVGILDVPGTTSTTQGTINGLNSCIYYIKAGGYSAINLTGGNLSTESVIIVP